MKKVIDRNHTRGHFNHGWLDTYHTFSFADYYNPDRIHFGALRVLNDDKVIAKEGFPLHPHRNMEVISFPLEGFLRHGDSLNNRNSDVITRGQIQVMSSGTGISHLEYNDSKIEDLRFLQVWIIPKTIDTKPRYNNYDVKSLIKPNDISLILSPNNEAYVNQDAYISWANMDKGFEKEYKFYGKKTGVYIFVLEGKIEVGGEVLQRRDGIGLWEVDSLGVKALENSEAIFFEVPMLE
ncbi:MAG: pirin family protein [Bacteroidales bacterium]|jgi:redox-sensitive bicupin YhaK (pirin superfamily)|nr:pirin family protein [Bacteroidales bacterium]